MSAPRVHLVYPHGEGISTPDAIGRELGRRLEAGYEVIYHGWTDRDVIEPEAGDILLGHPHPSGDTVFRRSLERPGWRRKLMLAPYMHGDLRYVAFMDGVLPLCDLFLAITGPYWFGTISNSPCSHWRPKMVHLDLAIDRGDYPRVKKSFGEPGKRRVVYVGHTEPYKNTQLLSKIAALVPESEFAWIGGGATPIRGLTALGRVDFGSGAGRDLVAGYDFLLTVGTADANPTTILEAMAWGLIPICTPTSGYEGIAGIPNVPVDDAAAAAAVIRRLLGADDSDLVAMQASNWRALDDHYNWDRFAAQVIEAIESTDSPPLLPESMRRRALFAHRSLTSQYGKVGRLESTLGRVWHHLRTGRAVWRRRRNARG
jgi:glycosyltransferase involved in cell wall biosynthesis